MARTELVIGKVRGDDGVGVNAGGTTGQALVKSSATDYDTTWRTVALSVNQALPDQSGNISVNTGVMTVNSQSPVNGNVAVDTGVMSVNNVSPTNGNVTVDTGVMTINSSAPVSGNIDIDTGVMAVAYNTASKKITKTIGSTVSDVVSVDTLKTDMALSNVENKSSATIRSELTSTNITDALGYEPIGDQDLITDEQIDALFE